MAQNVTVQGASYTDVPAVQLPKTGGGTATFTDTSDADATAENILKGKTAYVNGEKIVGTSEGGGGGTDPTRWQRPTDWPSLDSIDLSGQNVVYITYKANEENSYVVMRTDVSGTVTYDIGTVSNGVFTALETETLTGTQTYTKALTGYNKDYVVLRISGNFTRLQTNFTQTEYTDDTHVGPGQQMLEVYGSIPKVTSLDGFLRNQRFVESVTLTNCTALASMIRVAGDAYSLKNFCIAGTTKTMSAYSAFAQCRNLTYLYLNGISLNNVQAIMQATWVEYTDIDTWTVSMTGNIGDTFNTTRLKELDLSSWNVTATNAAGCFLDSSGLAKLDISTWKISGSAESLFQDTGLETIPEADYSGVTNTQNMFFRSQLKGSVTMPVTADTRFRTAFQYCGAVRSITIPASYTGQIAATAFGNTACLEEIHFLATTPPPLANKSAFKYGDTNAKRKIYVPYSEDHSVLEAYQTAAVWSTIAYPIVEEPQ